MIISEQIFNDTISLTSSELNKDIDNILLFKLKKQYEGLCKDDSFILKNSIDIIKRSIGKIETFDNINYIKYNISYKCDTISPNKGDKILDKKCIVSNINKMGIIAYLQIDEKYKISDNDFDNSPLIIIIPNDSLNESELNLNDINTGQKINIEILGYRIKYRNEKIQIVGKILN
jgi:DNA-directed RNA polymerase subunit E'/Rpb7